MRLDKLKNEEVLKGETFNPRCGVCDKLVVLDSDAVAVHLKSGGRLFRHSDTLKCTLFGVLINCSFYTTAQHFYPSKSMHLSTEPNGVAISI